MNKIRKLMPILLILSTFITGTTIIAQAEKPVKSFNIDITPHVPFFGLTLSANFDYENYGAWGYKYQWYIKEPIYGAHWMPWGEAKTVWFEKRQTSGIDIDLPYDLTPDSYYSHDVKVWLLKKNGDYLKEFKPPDPEPWIAWETDGGPSINVIHFVPDVSNPGYYKMTCKFNYDGYKARGYAYQWYKGPMGAEEPLGDLQYIWFDGWQTSGSNLNVLSIGGQTKTGRYRVEVWLIKPGGNRIPGTLIGAGIAFF